MIVTVEDQGRVRRQAAHQRVQECGDPELDGLGIRASEGLFELGPPPTLEGSHRSLAAERAVGEVIEEPALGPGGEVGVEGEVLGELEGLEAIDDEGFRDGPTAKELAVEEEAVTTEAGGVTGDGGVGGAQGTGDLTEGSPFAEEGGDGQEEIAPAEPVGGGEGRRREAPATGATAEVLEATVVGGSDVMAVTDEVPSGSGDVEPAARVGAAGGMEAPLTRGTSSTLAAHDPGRKPGSCRSVGLAADGVRGWRNTLKERALTSLHPHSSFHNHQRTTTSLRVASSPAVTARRK
jgi:hypothetical protein